MPATKEMIKELSFIDNSLQSDILAFIEIRNKVEHPKDQFQLSVLSWNYEGKTLYSAKIKTNNDYKRLFPENLESYIRRLAMEGLMVYFRFCNVYFQHITSASK